METINKENKRTMNDLSEMVKNGRTEEPVVFSEGNIDVPQVDVNAEQEVQDPSVINIICLGDWIDSNISNFPNIRKPTVSISGVDPAEQILLTIPVPNDTEGVEKRKLVVFDDTHLMPVLDKPAIDMQIYNNGFRVIYDLGNGIFVKSYGVRTGLISVFCNDINDQLIPYEIVRAKKRDTEIGIVTNDAAAVAQKMSEALDFEALQLRYKQSSKAEDVTTNLDAITWLLDRQATIEDINHHLQIDNVIIDTLA